MLERAAPPFSGRRTALKLVAEGVRNPRVLAQRVNRHNLSQLRRFRSVSARCNLCGHTGPLLYELPDLGRFAHHHIEPLRETLRCRGCSSKMRDRVLAAGLLDFLRDRFGIAADTVDGLVGRLPPEVRILDTDARSRLAKRLAGEPGVVRSLYDPARPSGAAYDERGVVNVDLEQMPFDDDRFDLVITSEVMEHVRHVDVAHREIARCVAPRGRYLFTVPYDPALTETLVLIDPVTDQPLVLPMHIHGDPGLREAGIKSYRVFGRDIVDDLRAAGLDARFSPVHDPAGGIWDGDLFVATPL